jgi:uncharacterized protein (DUF1800 family)
MGKRWRWIGAALAALCVLVACQDDGGDVPQSRAEAWRFLTQATFGPDEASVARVMTIGYTAWIDEQFDQGPSFTYQSFMRQREADIKASAPGNPNAKLYPDQVLEAFYTRALTDPAQLRARLSFALSEIFVVSLNDTLLYDLPGMVAGYMDTLDGSLGGSYRTLLEAVAKSPAMGHYLTYRSNMKSIPAIGHVPDENFAREVMQLFSIGLYELNGDGTVQLDAGGQPIPTYGQADVKGLAKVFTGWSHDRGPAYAGVSVNDCFSFADDCRDPDAFYLPMVAYPDYHDTGEKSFLGVVVAAQDTADPQASLTAALDRLASHPNTAPFFCRQLIQRLVSSNPSPAYVARVADRFTASGGNLRETVKAILLDTEARSLSGQLSLTTGKLREPILRVTAVLRAFGLRADNWPASGGVPYATLGRTSDPATSLAQTPLFAPSVFNFFRPGYVPPRTQLAAQGLVAPEMQLVSETSVTGYVNTLVGLLDTGLGNGVTLKLDDARGAANDDAQLTQLVADRLLGGTLSPSLQNIVLSALKTLPVPASDGSNAAAVTAAQDTRIRAAVLLVAASPEFLVVR